MTKASERLSEATDEAVEIVNGESDSGTQRAHTAPLKTNPLAADALPMLCRECVGYVGNLLVGFCHGKPPNSVIIGGIQLPNGQVGPRLGSFWPETAGDEWCLSFTPDRDKVLEPILPDMPDAEGSA